MSTAQTTFDDIVSSMTRISGVILGKMMRSPGLKYENKVFAFFHKDQMTFKLGEDFDSAQWGLTEVGPLSPFKTKPPLKAWLVVGKSHQEQWMRLTELAYERMKMGK